MTMTGDQWERAPKFIVFWNILPQSQKLSPVQNIYLLVWAVNCTKIWSWNASKTEKEMTWCYKLFPSECWKMRKVQEIDVTDAANLTRTLASRNKKWIYRNEPGMRRFVGLPLISASEKEYSNFSRNNWLNANAINNKHIGTTSTKKDITSFLFVQLLRLSHRLPVSYGGKQTNNVFY